MGSILKKKSQDATNRTVGNQLQAIPIVTVISLILFGGIGWRLSYLQLDERRTNLQKNYSNLQEVSYH